MSDPEANLRAAEIVAQILSEHQVDTVVIGGVALAAHRYVRHTDDIDLGVGADLTVLRKVATTLLQRGFTVTLHEPDGSDPLGGVMNVSGTFGLVQVISFHGRFPAVIRDAFEMSREVIRAGSPLRLVPLPHLVALKLYAGGYKSKADIIELLRRNPGLDLQDLRQLCGRYRLRGLDELLREAGVDAGDPGHPNHPDASG